MDFEKKTLTSHIQEMFQTWVEMEQAEAGAQLNKYIIRPPIIMLLALYRHCLQQQNSKPWSDAGNFVKI